MASAFDPYLQWLGIRDPQRPPNHYRLLGLELFENDSSVISMSSDRQMAHLRNFKTGPEAEVAERLLNELSAARICLLKPERKAAYDNQLRAAQRPVPTAKASVSVAPPVLPNINSSRPQIAPVVRTNAASSMTFPGAKRSWKPWAILASMLVLCGGLVALLVNKYSPSNDELLAVTEDGGDTKTSNAKNTQKPAVTVKPTSITTAKTKARENQPKSTEPANTTSEASSKNSSKAPDNNQVTKPVPEKSSGSNNEKPNKQQPIPTNSTPSVDLTTLLGEEVDPKTPETSKNDDGTTTEPSKISEPTVIAQVPANEPAKPAKLPVPDKATVAAKEKEIREIFAEEYKSQKTEVKTALAGKLRQSSAESKDDSAMRYVLLNESRANAILGGSVKQAVEITDELLRDYDLSENDERITLFSKLLTGGNRNAAYGQLVLEELRGSIVKFQQSDDYEVALKLVNMAQAAARNVRDPALVTDLTQRAKEINLQKAAYQRAKAAKDILAKNPNDPAANELWGAYLSFTKGDFSAGLPFLARGSSADLADLATRELQNKQSQADQLALADDWWSYGEKLQTQDAVKSINIRQHASLKYVELLSKLTGIEKAKAEKRSSEFSKMSNFKNNRELELTLAPLFKNSWKIEWGNGEKPDKLTLHPDGTCTSNFFTNWKIDQNQLLLLGGGKNGDSYQVVAKMSFNTNSFELEYLQNGKFITKGIGRPL